MNRTRLITTTFAVLAATATAASANAPVYQPGAYAGTTGQGVPITLTVARGHLRAIDTEVVDRCQRTTGVVNLAGLGASVSSRGAYHASAHIAGTIRVALHGSLRGRAIAGTIAVDDHACHIRERFRAGRTTTVVPGPSPSPTPTPAPAPSPAPTPAPKPTPVAPAAPLTIDSASISGRGVAVRVTVGAVPDDAGNPDTPDGLLVYASTAGCPASYAAALTQATSGVVDGFIANATIDALASYQQLDRTGNSYTMDLSSGTPFTGQSHAASFATVCAMRYSGQPGTFAAATNVVVATAQTPLVAGPGPVNNQP